MGASNSKTDSDTINWNNIKTDNQSSPIPFSNSLSKEATHLIASLNIPEITETQTSEFTVNHILDTINTNLNKEDKQKFNAILDQVSSQTNSDELSNTSPFISSEMYKNLVTSEKQEQKGGSKKVNFKKSKKGGSLNNDDSDTSSTSSDSELEDILDSNENEILKEKANKNKHNKEKANDNKHKDKHNKNKHVPESSESEMSGGELSYLSSSAHTDGDFSESDASNKSAESSSNTESSTSEPTKNKNSVTDENKDMMSTSISVNTDDINMVSDY